MLPILIVFILMGAGLGFLVTRLMRLEVGVFATVGLGILGVLIGIPVTRYLLVGLAGFPLPISLGLGGIIGVVLIIWAYKTWFHKR